MTSVPQERCSQCHIRNRESDRSLGGQRRHGEHTAHARCFVIHCPFFIELIT